MRVRVNGWRGRAVQVAEQKQKQKQEAGRRRKEEEARGRQEVDGSRLQMNTEQVSNTIRLYKEGTTGGGACWCWCWCRAGQGRQGEPVGLVKFGQQGPPLSGDHWGHWDSRDGQAFTHSRIVMSVGL